MNKKVFIILALLFSIYLIFRKSSTSVKETFDVNDTTDINVTNNNPNEHLATEMLRLELSKLNKELDHTSTEVSDQDIKDSNTDLNTDSNTDSNNVREEKKDEKDNKDTEDVNATYDRVKDLLNKMSNSPDMSKYILKSEVKSQPDMSKYILKSKLNHMTSSPDMSKYILKSKIKQSDSKVDMSKYILKSKIKSCSNPKNMSDYILKTEIPVCPKLPDMSKYILKSTLSTVTDNQSKPNGEKKSNNTDKKNTDGKKKIRAKEKKTEKSKKTKNTEKVTQQIKIVKKIKSNKPEEVKITVKNRAKPVQFTAQNEKQYVVRKLSLPKKEKTEKKCTNYIPRMPINLTRNVVPDRTPKKCKIYKKIIKHGDVYGAY